MPVGRQSQMIQSSDQHRLTALTACVFHYLLPEYYHGKYRKYVVLTCPVALTLAASLGQTSCRARSGQAPADSADRSPFGWDLVSLEHYLLFGARGAVVMHFGNSCNSRGTDLQAEPCNDFETATLARSCFVGHRRIITSKMLVCVAM